MNSTAKRPPSTCLFYWGKARPEGDGPAFHLLPYHCLDVAAVGHVYLQRNPALLRWLCDQLGNADETAVCEWVVFWLAVHDLGKFSLSFQAQRVDLVGELQGTRPTHALDGVRHDSLGLNAWLQFIQPTAEKQAWFGEDTEVSVGIRCWVQAVTGHHGQPPLANVPHMTSHFRPRDIEAAQAFVEEMRVLLLPPKAALVATSLPADPFERVSAELSWWIAGLAVLADWIGSNARIFSYQSEPTSSFADYWQHALTQADIALSASGVLPSVRQASLGFNELFPAIAEPSPLQAWATSVNLAEGPQIHLLEDVTGAGKTEAAVMLTHRLIAKGVADGFFIGLPTMATANAMYGRIAEVYDRLFVNTATNPVSLVLAHGKKQLVDTFAESVIDPGRDEGDQQQLDDSATRRCLRWLADHNKRALLAPAGVGTIDQALLGALQSKHQSLRLLGLMRKVLVVDEVHACDDYMQKTLETLLEFHARAGGSAVLLSATLTHRMKSSLLAAFARGAGQKTISALVANDYPLTTTWAKASAAFSSETPVATRPEVRRTVRVRYEPDRASVVAGILKALEAGQCVAWIRNTIGDALEAHAELQPFLGEERITLFHARFTLGDRLDTEDQVLERFGPQSTPERRAGQLLIATQVAEQSLDVDFDLVVSDLAPIDRLIQRAGRLRRHVRDATGRRFTEPGATDQRGDASLWVFGPAWAADPPAGWVRQALPKSTKVYPDHGQLWRTARALTQGQLTMPDDARSLIEGVFGDDGDVPPGLQRNAAQAEGEAYAAASQAMLNSVKLKSGYVRSSTDWLADTLAPSRLGEETQEILLGRWEGDALVPWRNDKPRHAWAYSTVRVARRLISEAAPERSVERQATIDAVREQLPGGGKWVVLLGLEKTNDGWTTSALKPNRPGKGEPFHWRYSRDIGLVQMSALGR